MKVQSMIEKPVICILGRSGSSFVDQALYSAPRVEDLAEIKDGILYNDMHITIVPRFVAADYPARAFETGNQIGGNYRCPCGIHCDDHQNFPVALTKGHQSMEEKVTTIKSGSLWTEKDLVIFKDLSKSEVEKETKKRKLYYGTSYQATSKAEMCEQLTNNLKGIQRFPALLVKEKTNMSEIGCQMLEVPNCEILHDFVGMVDNIMEELPHHLEPEKRDKLLSLYATFKNDKERMKG